MSAFQPKKVEGKLRRTEELSRVFAQGRAGKARGVIVIALKTEGPRRVGYSVGRRVGGAVERNRIRRLLREAYRLHENSLADGYDIVIVARREIAGEPFREAEGAFIKAAKRAGIWVEDIEEDTRGRN